jgi:AcrR family transcriptional regulator
VPPGDEPVRADEDRAAGGDPAVAQPGAARVVEVAVEMADPHRVDRDVRLGGELPGCLAPRVAVFAGDQQEASRSDEVLDRAAVSVLVEEAGIPMSSVYHYFGSKDGILLAVMVRGADRFFADLPERNRRTGRPAQHLATNVSDIVRTLERHSNFLRLLIVFAAQPPAAGDGEIQAVVGRVRGQALERLRAQIAIAFGDDPHSPTTDQLARFALAAIDGAVVAGQTDPGVTLERLLQPLPPALVGSRRALLARAT